MIKLFKKEIIKIFAVILVFFIEIYRKIRPIPPQIYFCYNQSIHHIYHSIFIAIELSNIQKKYPVVILSTSKEASAVIEEELSSIPNNVKFIKIYHPGYGKTNFNVNWFIFLCRLYMHRPKAVIVTDYFDNVFRQLLVKTFWIYTFHGLENRGYSHPHIKDYDLIVLPSENELERLESIVGLFSNYIIAGYSKFDYFYYHKLSSPSLFKNSKPVVIYNPHFEKSQSSFFDKGMELVKALSDTQKYNIIFMPHPDLARRYPETIDSVKGLQDVVVVTHPKINLDYMAIADIYITDVSSAVFEWLYFNKPVIFFNTKKIPVKDFYPSWSCGYVVEDVSSMLDAIDYSVKNPQEFQAKRAEMFDKNFFNKDKNVSRIIASGILDKLKCFENRAQFFFPLDISQNHGLNRLILPLAKKLNMENGVRIVSRNADINDFPNFKNIHTRIYAVYLLVKLLSYSPLRWCLQTMLRLEYSLYDFQFSRYVEKCGPVYSLQGMAWYTFKRAQKFGLKKILIAGSLHIEMVWQLHKEEEKIWGYDYEGLNLRVKEKELEEYEMADLIIVPSKLSYKIFLDYGISASKLEYIPVITEIDKNYYKRREPKKDDVFRILFVGRICPQKGIQYLIKAFQELDLPNSELFLFGATRTRGLANWFKQLIGKDPRIKTAYGDPRPAYEQASILVHPSLQESAGAVIPEALCYNLPIIVTENTGLKELIKDGENGFIIPIRDVEAIKDKIIYYYEKLNKNKG